MSSPGSRPPRYRQVRRRRVISSVLVLAALILIVLVLVGAVGVVREILGGIGSRDSGTATTATAAPSVPEPRTPSLDFTGFQPGNIVSDDIFYSPGTMTEDQIQAFIDQTGKGCRQGSDGTDCLAVYRDNSPTFEANDYCFAFQGQDGDTAASIVSKAATACGINPQVLLVMLQKEQGLLTASGGRLNVGRYDTAMGYGCPDHAACDPSYFGLGNQVYHAALQLRMYANSPDKYGIQPFADNLIAYNPDPTCGGDVVYVENYATAGLYNYTPYQPDQAALQGAPGGCSAVGNLNFYAYFKAWFG